MSSLNSMKWFDRTQPQTLQSACILLYIHTVFGILFGTFSVLPWGLVVTALSFAGAFGIANEKKWGYLCGVGAAIFPFVFRLAFWNGTIIVNGNLHQINLIDKLTGRSPINLIFEVALVALLVHPLSRNYQRIWFK